MNGKSTLHGRLQMVIRHLHGADSKHVESVSVLETFQGKTAWEGVVEVFDLSGHPKAIRCYAWSYRDEADDKFTAVPGIRIQIKRLPFNLRD